MDKEERGRLLVEQEEADTRISVIRNDLAAMGQILKGFADAILSNPENIVFGNAPHGLGNIPTNLTNVPTFNWDEIPKIEQIAQLIQDLRRAKNRLSDIQRSLRN